MFVPLFPNLFDVPLFHTIFLLPIAKFPVFSFSPKTPGGPSGFARQSFAIGYFELFFVFPEIPKERGTTVLLKKKQTKETWAVLHYLLRTSLRFLSVAFIILITYRPKRLSLVFFTVYKLKSH